MLHVAIMGRDKGQGPRTIWHWDGSPLLFSCCQKLTPPWASWCVTLGCCSLRGVTFAWKMPWVFRFALQFRLFLTHNCHYYVLLDLERVYYGNREC